VRCFPKHLDKILLPGIITERLTLVINQQHAAASLRCQLLAAVSAWLTAHSRVQLENLTVPQLVTKIPKFYRVRFSALFTTKRQWSPSCVRWSHLHEPIALKSGILNLLKPSGPVQGCNGIALPLPFLPFTCCTIYIYIFFFCCSAATQRVSWPPHY